jgi:outer membrane protein
MNLRPLLLAGLAACALSANSFAAPAAPSAAAAQPPITHGPPIPGICTFSFGQIFTSAKVGQAVDARLKVLGQQVTAELQPEADSISTEKRTLDSQAATMDAATLQARQANLQLRINNFEKRAEQRQQEMEATRQKELEVVQKEVDPILRNLYVQNHCSILFNRDSGAIGSVNPAMDLSGNAVVGLDQRIQTLTFDRVALDAQAGATPASTGR